MLSQDNPQSLPMTDEDIPLQLSAAEEKFEYWRCRVGLVLGPTLFLLLLWFPIPGLTPEAQRLVPALVLAIVFWITEAIPMAATALLAPALCVPLGVTGQSSVLAPFASPSIFCSSLMSNVATTAMMMPIGLGTPVGTPPNIMTIGFLREMNAGEVTFFDWMKLGVPLVFVLMAFLLWLLRPRGLAFSDRRGMDAGLRAQYLALGPVKPGERNAGIIFTLALFLWMWPGLVELITGQKILGAAWIAKHIPEENVGILCGLLVFLLPVNLKEWQFTLTWKQAAQIDWGTIFLFGGGLALGKMIESTGLAQAMGDGVVGQLGQPGMWLLVAAGIVIGLALSEATSNTASTNIMVPLIIPIALAAGLPAIPVALATGLACSFGFMLQVSTGPNALAYGTGLVPLPRMMKNGIMLDIAGAVAIWLVVWAYYH
jgi:sodium-dependent dicarboxylate transporter 2/3/5